MTDCLFCRIAKGDVPCEKLWEDEAHLAFLTIFPNTLGFTVVITKDHHPSKVEALPDKVYSGLLLAGKQVSRKLSAAFRIDRCALVAEGTGVDHAHLKIIPLHGLSPGAHSTVHPAPQKSMSTAYEGFVTTLEGPRADDQQLSSVAELIRNTPDP